MAQMQSMQTMILNLQSQLGSDGGQGNRRNSNRGHRNNQSNNNSNSGRLTNQQNYCWTYGACNHSSTNCRNPADGHKNTTTFSNRMGGSNRNLRE